MPNKNEKLGERAGRREGVSCLEGEKWGGYSQNEACGARGVVRSWKERPIASHSRNNSRHNRNSSSACALLVRDGAGR